MARTPSTRVVALRIACDAKQSLATRLQAAIVARPHITEARFARLLRLLIASGRRGPVVRQCLQMLAEIETVQRKRIEVDKVLAEESRRMQLKKQETQQ